MWGLTARDVRDISFRRLFLHIPKKLASEKILFPHNFDLTRRLCSFRKSPSETVYDPVAMLGYENNDQ